MSSQFSAKDNFEENLMLVICMQASGVQIHKYINCILCSNASYKTFIYVTKEVQEFIGVIQLVQNLIYGGTYKHSPPPHPPPRKIELG